MNTAERIVESYFRQVKKCFTISDVKIESGNNRQMDLLAFSPAHNEAHHVEVTVTQMLNWRPKVENLSTLFEYKFLGRPKGPNEAGKKDFGSNIEQTYSKYGLNPQNIIRCIVVWYCDEPVTKAFYAFLSEKGYPSCEILSMRDKIIPDLLKAVGTGNYDDDVLRLLGFIKAAEEQTKGNQK
jgi:hypothetical protein